METRQLFHRARAELLKIKETLHAYPCLDEGGDPSDFLIDVLDSSVRRNDERALFAWITVVKIPILT